MKDNWKIRRRWLFAIFTFCMAVITYVLVRNMDTSVAETAITMSFTTIIGCIGSYIFGATWDDKV